MWLLASDWLVTTDLRVGGQQSWWRQFDSLIDACLQHQGVFEVDDVSLAAVFSKSDVGAEECVQSARASINDGVLRLILGLHHLETFT